MQQFLLNFLHCYNLYSSSNLFLMSWLAISADVTSIYRNINVLFLFMALVNHETFVIFSLSWSCELQRSRYTISHSCLSILMPTELLLLFLPSFSLSVKLLFPLGFLCVPWCCNWEGDSILPSPWLAFGWHLVGLLWLCYGLFSLVFSTNPNSQLLGCTFFSTWVDPQMH